MRISTLIKYLAGSEQAILAVASSRSALWLGLLFVVSAGFAREYDGEDLLHEPWFLLIPLAASLASSFVLYVLLAIVARLRRGESASFWGGYRVFLGLYWLTAPLAWLYAIPMERLMTAGDSVAANLCLLGIVSLWRVALMTRVVAVLYRCHPAAALLVVMLFADGLAMAILFLTPLPVFDIMGGIHQTAGEQIIQCTAFCVGFWGIVTLPIWFVGTIVVAVWRGWADPDVWRLRVSEGEAGARVSRGLWTLAAASLIVWVFVLPFTQGEQQNRRYVEKAFRSGRVAEGLRYMSQRQPSDFPPHFDPPPHIGYGDTQPTLQEILNHILAEGAAPWVRKLHTDKLAFHVPTEPWSHQPIVLETMSDEQLARYVEMLDALPDGPRIASGNRHQIEDILNRRKQRELPALGAARHDAFDAILRLAARHDKRARSVDELLAQWNKRKPPTESPAPAREADPGGP